MADVFISYPHEYRNHAEAIAIRLLGNGHRVFWDTDLIPAESFDKRIRKEIRLAKHVIFLIGPEFLAQGRYAQTELGLVRKKWPNPAGKVLPAVISPVNNSEIPAYLTSVHMVIPSGEVASEVSDAYEVMTKRKLRLLPVVAVLGLLAGIGALAWHYGILPPLGDVRWNEKVGATERTDIDTVEEDQILAQEPPPTIPTYRRGEVEDPVFYDFGSDDEEEAAELPAMPSVKVIEETYVCNLEAAPSNPSSCAYKAKDICSGYGYPNGRVLNPVRDYTPQNDSPNWRGSKFSCTG